MVLNNAKAQKNNNQKPKRDSNKQDRQPKVAGIAVRQAALRMLGAVIDKATSLDGLTDNEHGHPQYLALDVRDRSLVRAILGAALRNRGAIDNAIDQFVDRPLPQNASALKHLIHISAAQILYLDVPDHATINLAVTIAKSDPRLTRFSGLVNAILRRFTREKDAILQQDDVLSNVPLWFAQMLERDYGKEKAQDIIKAQAYEPPLDITASGDVEAIAQELGGEVLPFLSIRIAEVDCSIPELPGFAQGKWWVQDVAASLPARLMKAVKGQNIADLCAAPGGKTAQLASTGANVTAVDASTNRMKRLIANMERLNFNVATYNGELQDFKPEQPFDALLLDAPCSSTGTIRRHPDVLWTKSLDEIGRLADLQLQLLEKSIDLVKIGGMILFSNCSLSKREGERLVTKFLKNRTNVALIPFTVEELCQSFNNTSDEAKNIYANILTDEGYLRTTPADLPNENPKLSGMDGFFAARFKRLS
ncbi:RsmB/NOP family class I SAM-dependent RNA methyltransferase [Bartonella sp. HY038]|uniref:RsmB/NOP family class I SAM-dependent RNA methyltransferase n=1 Tax=Bartonella sp. HY038 TaxID=2759660 RepID=UPI00352EDD6D